MNFRSLQNNGGLRKLCFLPSLFATLVAHAQGPERVVNGFLFLHADAKAAARAQVEWHDNETWSEFVKHFPAERYVVSPMGKRSAIVIGLDSGPLGRDRALLDSTKRLIGLVGKDGTLDVKDMLKLTGLTLGSPPAGSSAGSVGLCATVNFTVKSGRGSKTFSLPVQNAATADRDQALREHPLVPGRATAGVETPNDQKSDAPKDYGNQATMSLFGVTEGYFAEAMRDTSKLVDEVSSKLDAELAISDMELLRKLRLNGSGLPGGEVPLSDLSKQLRDRLTSGFGASWHGLGFASEAEAEGFLQAAQSVQMTTSLGMRFCLDPGDPAKGIPSRSGIVNFGSVKGGMDP